MNGITAEIGRSLPRLEAREKVTGRATYIADITPVAERSKKMGLIGMAFGLGFVCGPPLGALGIQLFGFRGPGILATALCAWLRGHGVSVLRPGSAGRVAAEPGRPVHHGAQTV